MRQAAGRTLIKLWELMLTEAVCAAPSEEGRLQTFNYPSSESRIKGLFRESTFNPIFSQG